MTEHDYVLGTHDAEIERLGLQHRVWRDKVLAAWLWAGISGGHTVLDVGAGPGYATLDLAEIVGASGEVISLERSQRFIEVLKARAAGRALDNITVHEADVMSAWPAEVKDGSVDFSWIRWLLCFVNKPEFVIEQLAKKLKPGATAIFHEYSDYKTWKMSPEVPELEYFVDVVIANWRHAGGEPDIARQLPGLLEKHGFEIIRRQPLVYVLTPRDPMWQWPMSFVKINFSRLVELGEMTQDEADRTQSAILNAAASGKHTFTTPMVLEIIARKK